MNFSDEIDLIVHEYRQDADHNQYPVDTKRRVFCDVLSVGRSEYHAAAQTDLRPEHVFRLYSADYNGEKEVEYQDMRYTVVRTYAPKNKDKVDLTCERKVGNEG